METLRMSAHLLFAAEKAQLKDEFNFLETMEGHLHQELLVLPYMLNLPQIFEDSIQSDSNMLLLNRCSNRVSHSNRGHLEHLGSIQNSNLTY